MLVSYYSWLAYVFNWFTSGKATYPNSYGAANGGLIILTAIVVIAYSVGLLFKMGSGENGQDYSVFLCLVILPVIIFFLF